MEPLVLDTVVVRSISVSEMENNVYLLTSRASGDQVLIDAADDAAAIEELIRAGAADSDAPPRLTHVLTTHQHWDHVRALAEVSGRHAAATVAGSVDAPAIPEQEGGAPITRPVEHGDFLYFDGFVLEVVHLRGHTPGSIAYVLRDASGTTVIFSGDSLFPGGPGKTWSAEDFQSLMADLRARIFDEFDDETLVLPGHGASTTLGAERPQIPEWLARGW
jgi:glyoxylase-like metal-dependent hydrolase (beta-lactamase superfamily II)